jgi:hypothetical protein
VRKVRLIISKKEKTIENFTFILKALEATQIFIVLGEPAILFALASLASCHFVNQHLIGWLLWYEPSIGQSS